MHKGHQALIEHTREKAHALGLPAVAITFEPLPIEFLYKDKAPARIMTWREKMIALQETKVDATVSLKFDRAFSRTSAETFIKKYLIDFLNVKHLVLGEDFHFGHQRRGNIEMLRTLGAQYGMQVGVMNDYTLQGARISSTMIRQALARGEFAHAEDMSGRRFSISGHICHGDKRGKEWGIPTTNMPMRRLHSPVEGVFATWTHGLDKKPVAGASFVGRKPLLDRPRLILETFLFDFNADVYGKHVTVEFAYQIRGKLNFDNVDGLKYQIALDIEAANRYFGQIKNEH